MKRYDGEWFFVRCRRRNRRFTGGKSEFLCAAIRDSLENTVEMEAYYPLKRLLALILAFALTACPLSTLAEKSAVVNTPMESASEAARSNMILAASKLDGLVVPSNGFFSFNEVVGPRTAAYGFVPAKNGRGVTVTGGGVAQAATTLYLALFAADADVQYQEKRTYGADFTADYVEDPNASIMVDSAAGLDFSFTNMGGDLIIEMWASDRKLYCSVTVREETAASNFRDSLPYDAAPELSENISGQYPGLAAPNSIAMSKPAASAAFPLSGTDALISNVRIAADSICDTVLEAGDLFSFNAVVGPREARCGYQPAVNGRGAMVVGGGVAQVASALWLAVRQLDCVAVVQKSTYGKRYNQNYVASSNDAILTDYKGKTDFSFRYTGEGTMTISTRVSDGMLICEIDLN